MKVIYIQQGNEESINNVGQLIYDSQNDLMCAYGARGDFLGSVKLSKCDDYTVIDFAVQRVERTSEND